MSNRAENRWSLFSIYREVCKILSSYFRAMSWFLALITLSACILTLGIAVRPSPYRWLLWVLIATINGYCYFSPLSKDPIRQPAATSLCIASDYILLTDVQRELRQIGQREPISNFGIWIRFRWAVQLMCSPRGIGWTHEPKSVIPPYPKLTRVEFLRSRFISLVMALVGSAIASILISTHPGFSKHAPPSYEQPLSWRFYATALFFSRIKLNAELYYFTVALLFVGTGISEPSSWPDLFGSLADAYTVRRWWGYD